MRMYLSQVINLNSQVYSTYFIPCRQTKHLKNISKIQVPGTWGTQLELQAVSDCFQLPVYMYVYSPHPGSGIYRWLIFRPRIKLLHVPSKVVLPKPSLPYTEIHIQLAHTGCHYDSVTSSVALDQKLNCPHLPDLDEAFETRIISSDSGSDSEEL